MLQQPFQLRPCAVLLEAPDNALRRKRWLATTLLLVGCGFFALPHDLAIARAVQSGTVPEGLMDVLQRAETFAHGIGIAAILVVLFLADPSRRWAVPRVVLAVVASGLSANGIKLLIGRLRPHSADLTANLTDSFTGLFPFFSVGSAERSTPSAHTAAAVAFAIALAWLYPRGRAAFFTLALLAAFQRIAGGAHFLSDVLWGAAVGYFIGRGIIAGWLTAARFNRWEALQCLPASGPLPPRTQPASPRRDRAA